MSAPGTGVLVTIITPQSGTPAVPNITVTGTFTPTSGSLSIATDDGSGTAMGPNINGSGYTFQLNGVNFGTRTITVTLDAGDLGSDSVSVRVKVNPPN
jgi:hypothetical protein